jgi:hypothetical protein
MLKESRYAEHFFVNVENLCRGSTTNVDIENSTYDAANVSYILMVELDALTHIGAVEIGGYPRWSEHVWAVAPRLVPSGTSYLSSPFNLLEQVP